MFDIGDFISKFGHLIGWAAIVGIAWKLRGSVENHISLWKSIDERTQQTDDKVTAIQSNHLAHMETDMASLTKSNDKAVEVLQDISGGIKILVDRGHRDTIVETKIRHVAPDDKV